MEQQGREILFRGKRMDNGKWEEGFLVVANNVLNRGKAYILPTVSDFSYGDNGDRIRIGCFVEVDPATVGQYTGLTDKNGVKIFEGDICTVNGKTGVFFVNWSQDEAMFIIDGYSLTIDFDNVYPHELEVIGNIHDNPKLLENGDEES